MSGPALSIHLELLFTVQIVPESFSFEEAATLPIVYGTCYYAMFDVVRLQKGEKILIYSAAEGVGQATIHLAELVGAEIFATVGSSDKRHFLIDEFGIPDDHIFSRLDAASFSLRVMRATQGTGVDVLLNSLAGESLRATWECIAPFGRFLEIEKGDIIEFGSLPMNSFAKNVSFAAIDLLYTLRSNLPLARRLLDDVRVLAEQGKFQPPKPLHVFNYTNIEDVFRLMQSGKHSGKIVITPKPGEMVFVSFCLELVLFAYLQLTHSRPFPIPDRLGFLTLMLHLFSSGGLGGLGRSMARWMVRRGAKHLVLLSRTGGATKMA